MSLSRGNSAYGPDDVLRKQYTQGVEHKVAFFDVDAVVPGGGGAPAYPRLRFTPRYFFSHTRFFF